MKRWRAVSVAVTLCLAVACGGDEPSPKAPPAPPDPAAIARLVADLDHPEYRRRAVATQKLTELGAAAEAPLKALLAGKPSLEAAGRGREILDEIAARRWQAQHGGGPVVGGLSVRLTTDKPVYRAGERPVLIARVTNAGDRPRAAVPPRRADMRLPHYTTTSSMSHGEIEVRALSTGRQGSRGSSHTSFGGLRAQEKAPDLAPGAHHEQRFSLQEMGGAELAPGEYEARFVYWAKSRGLAPGAPADVPSNPVRFRVLAPEPKAQGAPAKSGEKK